MYYLQIILGALLLTAIAVPLSNNYKAIKVKNSKGNITYVKKVNPSYHTVVKDNLAKLAVVAVSYTHLTLPTKRIV